MREEVDRGAPRARHVQEVRDEESVAATAEPREGRAQRFAERRGRPTDGDGSDVVEPPEERARRGAAGERPRRSRRVGVLGQHLEPHRLAAREGCCAGHGRHAQCRSELGPLARAHAGAAVDEEVHVDALLVLEHLHLQRPQARVRIPVDIAKVVAGRVRAVLVEDRARARRARRALAEAAARAGAPGHELERDETLQRARREEARHLGRPPSSSK